MPTGKCKLCNNNKELKDSHIIPNAMFHRILKANSGWAITFQDDAESWVKRSSESWSEYLLCSDCEKFLNEEYEQYSISVLRNALNSVEITKHKNGITFKSLVGEKFQLFLVSIVWRAAVSSLEVYSKVELLPLWAEEIRTSLLNHRKIRTSLVDIRISRLHDKTKNGFTSENLKNILVSPFFRKHEKNISYCFLLEGFFVEFFLPGLNFIERNKSGMIKPNKGILLIPYINIFNIPEVANLMATALGKHFNGKSTMKS